MSISDYLPGSGIASGIVPGVLTEDSFGDVYEAYEQVYRYQNAAGMRSEVQMEQAMDFWEEVTNYLDLEEGEDYEGVLAVSSAVAPVEGIWDEKLSRQELKDMLDGNIG